MPKQEGLKPIGHSIKIIIDKIKAEREAKRNKNKPIRTQPKIPGLAQGGLQKSYRGDDPMKRRKKPKSKSPKGLGPQQSALPKKQGAPQSPGGIGRFGPEGKDSKSKGAGPYGEKPPQLKKSKKERREKYRKEVQKHGGNVIYADEWDKIDPGLKKGIGLKKGGVKKAFGGQLMGQQRPEPTSDQTLNVMQQNVRQKLGMKKGGKWSSGPKPGSLEYWQMSVQKPKRKARGGTSKGKGSSFMKEYKKRVYGRAKGGSMVQGPMKRARGSGAAIKGTRFQGTF